MGEKEKGTFAQIFDPSFKDFVFPRIARVLFVLLMVLIGLWCIFLIATTFVAHSALQGILMLVIGAPAIFIVGVLWMRLWFEYWLVLFRIEDRLGEVEKGIAQLVKEEGEKEEGQKPEE